MLLEAGRSTVGGVCNFVQAHVRMKRSLFALQLFRTHRHEDRPSHTGPYSSFAYTASVAPLDSVAYERKVLATNIFASVHLRALYAL